MYRVSSQDYAESVVKTQKGIADIGFIPDVYCREQERGRETEISYVHRSSMARSRGFSMININRCYFVT